MAGHTVIANNRLSTDGTYNYTYDNEGNRTARENIASGERTEYQWDHRNRLVKVTEKDEMGSVVSTTENSYDVFDHWIRRSYDADGQGMGEPVDTFFAYDGNQIALQFDGPEDSDLSHRYLWGPNVDQFFADEQVTSLSTAGNVPWGLADHQGTLRDIADRHEGTGVTTVTNHRKYETFGTRVSETNASVDLIFGYTGRLLDETTGLQDNWHRPYDSKTGSWPSEDRMGFQATDANLSRYVKNSPTNFVDPSGDIIVFVEGINTDETDTFAGSFVAGMRNRWKKDGAPDQDVVFFRFGKADTSEPAGKQYEGYNLVVAQALKKFIDKLNANNPCGEPIYIVAFSNGAIIVNKALEDGMKAHGVVYMGAALDRTTNLTPALKNTGWMYSFYSQSDWAAARAGFAKGGGTTGFITVGRGYKGFTQVRDDGVTHTSSKYYDTSDSHAEMEYEETPQFLAVSQKVGWVSYLAGYKYVATLVALKSGQKKCVDGSLTRLFPDSTGKHVVGSVYISAIRVFARMKVRKGDARRFKQEFGNIYEYNSGVDQKKKK